MNTKRISLSGTYYTFGKQFGVTVKQEIKKTLEVFQQSDQYTTVQEFLKTDSGRILLQELDTRVRAYCQDVVSELRGMADGAALDFMELFLLNLTPEWSALFPESKGQSATNTDQTQSGISKGCTDIHLAIPDTGDVFLGHNEDINPKLRDCGYIVRADIYTDESKEELIESFTEYVTAGILPGGKFGFNRHGLMYGSIDVMVMT